MFVEQHREVISKESYTREFEWKVGHPTVIIDRGWSFLGREPLPSQLSSYSDNYLSDLTKQLRKQDCPILEWDGAPINFFAQEKHEPIIIVHRVWMGEIPDAVVNAAKSGGDLKTALKYRLPESGDSPLAHQIGKKMGTVPNPHPNYVNFVYFRDNHGILKTLANEPMVEFGRAVLGKAGSFKAAITGLSDNNGYFEASDPVFVTMERGHPRVRTSSSMAFRLRAYGSVEPVSGVTNLESFEIPQETWMNSMAINNLKNFGYWLGEKRLIRPPVNIGDYILGEKLKNKIISLVNWLRQQEGADGIFPLDESLHNFDFTEINPKYPYAAPMLLSRTGKDGKSLKTDPTDEDFVPLIPYKPEGSKFYKVAKLAVPGLNTGNPSQEAEEFSAPWSLTPYLAIKSKNGRSLKVPFVVAASHTHNWLANWQELNPEEYIVIILNPNENPPVPCGVDGMQASTATVLWRGYETWQGLMKEGKRPKTIITLVFNHGMNMFNLLTEEVLKSGDQFYNIKEGYDKGHFVNREVPQI